MLEHMVGELQDDVKMTKVTSMTMPDAPYKLNKAISMFKCARGFEALNDIQRTMLDLKLLHEDPFFPTLKRLVEHHIRSSKWACKLDFNYQLDYHIDLILDP